jgi:hypothetical protein
MQPDTPKPERQQKHTHKAKRPTIVLTKDQHRHIEHNSKSKQRTVFLWAGLGIVIILLNDVLIREVLYPYILGDDLAVQYTPDATRGIDEIVGVVRYFLQFLAVIAFAAFLYGGGQMILSFGNEDQVENGKRVLTGAAIGIVIILSSYAIVSTFISGTAGGG